MEEWRDWSVEDRLEHALVKVGRLHCLSIDHVDGQISLDSGLRSSISADPQAPRASTWIYSRSYVAHGPLFKYTNFEFLSFLL